MSRVKIKIEDNNDLRKELYEEYNKSSQVKMCKYSLVLAQHVLEIIKYPKNEIIQEGFQINEKWQNGQARMHDVRQIGFKIHRLARESKDEIIRTALRVVGQAISSGHMKEHAMVASDYAIKLINLLHPKDQNEVKQERQWQITQIKLIKE